MICSCATISVSWGVQPARVPLPHRAPGRVPDEVRRVYSHPRRWRSASIRWRPSRGRGHRCRRYGSVRFVKEQGCRDAAAIASAEPPRCTTWPCCAGGWRTSAQLYAVPTPRARAQPPTNAKTSLAFAGRNEPGLLFRCLSAFALRDIDLTKIESRPIRGVPWEYIFYLDFSGSLAGERCQRAVDQLRELAPLCVSWLVPPAPPHLDGRGTRTDALTRQGRIMKATIAVLPGDGIGVEVTAERKGADGRRRGPRPYLCV